MTAPGGQKTLSEIKKGSRKERKDAISGLCKKLSLLKKLSFLTLCVLCVLCER